MTSIVAASPSAHALAKPSVRRRALLLLNTQARLGAQRADDVIAALHDTGLDIVRPQTGSSGSVAQTIRRHGNSVDMVIVAGGDGSLHAAAQGLAGTGTPLGVIPLGTANDFAKTIGLPMDLAGACAVIAAGRTKSIDAGFVNGIYFLTEMSIGLSPLVARSVSRQDKAKRGPFALLLQALRVMRRMRRFRAALVCDGRRHFLWTAQLTIGNSRHFGGFVASDEASIDDRRLDLYSIDFRHIWNYLGALRALLRRRYDEERGVFTLHGRHFRISTRKPQPIEADGEIVAMTPAKVCVIPSAISVFVPDSDARAR
jgi:YegS/Rv2252/BmrU family lipid kinase